MATTKITDLTAYTDPVNTDVLPIVDVTSDVTKKVSVANVMKNASLGTAAAPGISFDGDPNTGIYSPGADQVAISTNGSGRLFVDASGRVGMGAAEGTYAASVTTTGNNGFLVKTGTASAVQIYAGNTGGEAALGTLTSDPLNLVTAGSSRIRITSAGLVGVGTSSPGSLLTSYPGNVSTLGAKASTGLLIDNNGSAGNISQIGLGYTFSGTYHPVAIAAITDSGTGSTRADLHFATRSLTTDSAPDTRMIIKSDGKVGIGTGSPGAALDVASSGAGIKNVIHIRSSLDSISDGGAITFSNTTPATAQLAKIAAVFEGGTYQGSLRFYTNTDVQGANPSEKLRITPAGNVGIGSTAPTNSLEVVGGATSNLFAVKASSSGDCLGVTARSAGNGAIVSALNSAQSDYEPLEINGEIIYFQTRTGAGTVSERARIDSSGRLLVGTSSALTGTDTQYSRLVVTGNTSGASAGIMSISRPEAATSITTDEVLGTICFADSGAGEYGRISCAADANAGTNDYPGRLVFSTTADGASSPTERMRIDSAGQVGIAVAPSVGVRTSIKAGSGGGRALSLLPGGAGDLSVAQLAITKFDNDTTTSQYFVQFNINDGAAASGRIVANGANQAAFASTSDIRLKENIQDLPSQLEKICSLRPVEFDYVESEGGGHQIGFIAQELQTVYPDAVSAGTDENQYLSVTGWSKTEARLVKALQEAVAKIESLEARLTAAGL